MKFFLDTALVDELRLAAATGIVDGVTTNPSLIAQTGRPLEAVIKEIVGIIDGPISVEGIATERDAMVQEGKKDAAIHKNVVVKLPLTEAGVAATKILTQGGIKVNVTLIFSALQALVAAKAGATYVSPFVGRLDDIGQDGMVLVEDICKIFKNYGLKTEVLAASLRHPQHILASAMAGAHVGTFPLKVLKQLYKHPLPDLGLEKFLSAWKSVPQQ